MIEHSMDDQWEEVELEDSEEEDPDDTDDVDPSELFDEDIDI